MCIRDRAHAAERYDVVLMDVQMPEMDGLEATAVIRKREAGSGDHTPIIALTAHAMKGDRERLLFSSSANDYVAKPIIDQQGLVDLVRRHIRAAEAVKAELASRTGGGDDVP